MTGCICLQGIIISQFDQYDYNKRPEEYIILYYILYIDYPFLYFVSTRSDLGIFFLHGRQPLPSSAINSYI